MKEIDLKGCKVFFGDYSFLLENLLCGKKTVYLFDERVWEIYGKSIDPRIVIRIEAKERNKNLKTVQNIYKKLLELEADRYTYLVGVGGGVTLDITGFVGSTFMRGMPFGFLPTSLLAQVDAAFGGKNGVNFCGIKNLVGTITQPSFVIIDPGFLKTLPSCEWENGFAEVIKYGIIASKDLFETLESLPVSRLKDSDLITKIIYESLLIKASIVAKDRTDFGERRKLNFGHTFGHAIEMACQLSHGRAISVGMMAEIEFSRELGLLSKSDISRIENLLGKFGLPTDYEPFFSKALKKIKADKKKEGDSISIVLIEGIGRSRIEKVKIEAIGEVINGLRKHWLCVRG
ncbi:MAG: 3-dehydroquinate synthase [Desulfobacterota bacterium]|nr:3-dehydroquinate synthase [Thermodesulfobacteriota bacterium]MDW8002719.1 3-dehydroquinate synthase [Deltaproteobacteria bacterium]